MCVDHGGTHVGVPQQLLHRPDVVPVLEEMRRKRMPQGVTTGPLPDLGPSHGIGNGPLEV